VEGLVTTLFEKIAESDIKIKVLPPTLGHTITFSNTSGKWFALTIDQIVGILKDIKDNVIKYQTEAGSSYVEKSYRNVFSATISDEVAHALCTVQSLPMFTVLAQIIHYASYDTPYVYKSIDLDSANIETAIAALDSFRVFDPKKKPPVDPKRIKGGFNRIYYGAPGTGKSHTINEKVGKNKKFRTVFHPDVQNSDFLGTLKPVTTETGDISYRFSPGAFAKAYVYAINQPQERVWLIIEELNRAPAAAVFGDLFLLLDRDKNGKGVYDVDCPSEEASEWIADKTGDMSGTLELPSNLAIVATMNSADQGVYPLDTAFRRRWRQTYIKLAYDKTHITPLIISGADGTPLTITWADFVKTINTHLIDELGIAEDRLMGQWFVKEEEIKKGRVPGKVMLYLWDDLLRNLDRGMVFNTEKCRTYGELNAALKKGKPVFSTNLLNKLLGAVIVETETQGVAGDGEDSA